MGAVSEKSVLITGCSTGIGYHCAHAMKERGWRVFATARKPQDLARLKYEGLETVYLDYADPKSISHCADFVLQQTGGKLLGLFNNGAYGQPGAIEDLSTDILRRQLETNVFGWHDLTRRLLPAMRKNGQGRIVQNSSVLGLVALKWRGAYNASKFAIEGLSDTMRLELEGTGVHVVLIEPGPIKSKFVNSSLEHFRKNIDVEGSVHKDLYQGQLARMEGSAQTAGGKFKLGPEAVQKCLVKALEDPNPRAHYYVTKPTFILGALRRLLPQRALDPLLAHFSDN
ncbi:MAG: SDR family oxidoreductase [Alphaproteobacteria bacterium]|nr:SDR family oxidoreductase [Alphaproteobacteria bacterium]